MEMEKAFARASAGMKVSKAALAGNERPGAKRGIKSHRLPALRVRGIDDSFSLLASSARQDALHSTATKKQPRN